MDLAKQTDIRKGLEKKGKYPLTIKIKVKGKEPMEVTGELRTRRKNGKMGELPHLIVQNLIPGSFGPGTRVIGG